MTHDQITSLLGDQAESLLNHRCTKIPQEVIEKPHQNHVARVFKDSDRNRQVLNNLEKLYTHGRLKKTGYLSIFPVDQGVEHTAGYSFAHNPWYLDPANIVEMAIEAGCSAVASTLGVLGLASKKYADKIPFIVKLNHNELLTYPKKYDQVMFASAKQAYELGAKGVGATIYFGSEKSRRQIVEVSKAFAQAHQLGMFTVLWTYPRNAKFKTTTKDYHTAADITGQANYLGVTIEADIIKQKLPTIKSGFKPLDFAKYSETMYQSLLTDHPIDLVRYQVANCYLGKISLINSGGPSHGEDDLKEAIITAVINKRGGGSGLIMGRKVFNRSFEKGLKLLHAVQDVYLDNKITVA